MGKTVKAKSFENPPSLCVAEVVPGYWRGVRVSPLRCWVGWLWWAKFRPLGRWGQNNVDLIPPRKGSYKAHADIGAEAKIRVRLDSAHFFCNLFAPSPEIGVHTKCHMFLEHIAERWVDANPVFCQLAADSATSWIRCVLVCDCTQMNAEALATYAAHIWEIAFCWSSSKSWDAAVHFGIPSVLLINVAMVLLRRAEKSLGIGIVHIICFDPHNDCTWLICVPW